MDENYVYDVYICLKRSDALAEDDDTVREEEEESSRDVREEPSEEKSSLEETQPTSPTVGAQIRTVPELTLVLVGDSDSVEIGPNNILLDCDDLKSVEPFSSKLYDLCGRHIRVINMLGLPSVDSFPVGEGVHAFLLLLTHGSHTGQQGAGARWLQDTFGRGAFPYLLTLVTHSSEERCHRASTDLKTSDIFTENRFHTCEKSMTDENEIIALLTKIDTMVCENNPHCYTGPTCDGNKGKQPEASRSAPKTCDARHTHTAAELKSQASETEPKTDVVNASGEPFQRTQDSRGVEGPGVTSGGPPVTTEEGTSDVDMDVDTEVGVDALACMDVEMDTEDSKDEQSMENSEKSNGESPHDSETETLLRRLHLLDKYQEKMTPAHFLRLGPPVKQQHDTCEKDVARTFLQRLMMLDYRTRYIPVRRDSSDVSQLTLSRDADPEESDFDALFSYSVDLGPTQQSHIHPMDVQMAAFHCSNSFLRQNMITKLAQCQYALPLLVPDPVTKDIECPLWTFRQITKNWKITKAENSCEVVTMKSMPIYKAETAMVSFFRLGSLSLSKSQLMNTLINDRHNTFFHRNCPGSTKSYHFMDGLAEIAWYCPAGKPNDAFTDCVAFCNLHGDALSVEQQRDILTERSSVNVVLLPALSKEDRSWTVVSALLKSPKPLVCLIVDNECGSTEIREGKYKLGLKDKSQSDVSEQLKGIIRHILSKPHKSFILEAMADVPGISVDENDTVCQKGKAAALKIVALLKGMDVSNIKGTFLPCQGSLWRDWCKINKDQYNLKGHVERERCMRQEQLVRIRQEQCAVSCSQIMRLFIQSLSSLSPEEKAYFLKWTQILLDSLSTGDLSSILQKYDEKWSEVLELKKKHHRSDQLMRKQIELEDISEKLQSATFGIEHIFREMGQIFEAHMSLQKQPKLDLTDWSKYPKLAAELMVSGYPMELMDGDAGHVPLTWISSLLDEVNKKLGSPRVFVLSVMGIQSSGKSTMLNAMFGLQFAVSAGRCTKGAFMQLVKVSEEIQKAFKFEYILVVDTEGLRALELAGTDTLHHDNELATFVVGLGNMTLLNIFGENPAEMQDILQIVVQAFMRMKKVKLSPSCIFVHQNVTDIGAAEKNMDGKRRLQEKLDQMAKLAAKEEVSDAECFNDIITFDVQEDVKYFSQLWEGSPPMAPPNPGYSESIQELKNIILAKASQSNGIALSQFKSKIQDLWNALLKENFVFSFKNTLEIAVYRKLEVQYGNWTWALRSIMLKVENQLYTRIENGKLDKVDVNYLNKEMSKTYEDIKKEMTAYFEDDRDKEMLVQWRGRFESKIKQIHDEQVSGVRRKLDEVIQQKKACKKMDDSKKEFENALLQRSKELAQQLRDKAKDEEELEKHFNEVWNEWVKELTGNTNPINDIDLREDQNLILQDLCIDWRLIEESRSSGSYKRISVIGDYFHYVSLNKDQELGNENDECQDNVKRRKGKFSLAYAWASFQQLWRSGSKPEKEPLRAREGFPYEEQEFIRLLIETIEHQTVDIIHSKPVAERGYSPTYLQEVAKNVKEKVTEFESGRKYALKKEFSVDLLLFAFDRVGPYLSSSHEKFKMKNDAVTFVQSKKFENYKIFKSFCKGNSSAVVLGEMICYKLKSSAVEAVCIKTAIDLAGEMKCNFPAFNGNRLNLEKHVLQSLAERDNFDGFITYIRTPRKEVEAFIREEVNKYIFTKHKDKAKTILKKNVADIGNRIDQASFDATDKVKARSGDTHMWLKEFSRLLKDDLTLETINSSNFSDINNFDFLRDEIKKGLASVNTDISKVSLDKLKEFRVQPDQILIDQLCKCCWVQCPFCAAICTNTMEDHDPDDHNVPFHRPSGIKGWHYRGTEEMTINFCTTNVASDGRFYPHHDSEESVPYKLYRTAGPKYANWRITADESKLIYWKWFVSQFQKQVEEHYNLKFEGRGEIPSEWKEYTKKHAIESLDEMCE